MRIAWNLKEGIDVQKSYDAVKTSCWKDVADNEEFISTLILTHKEYTRTINPWSF